MDILYVLLHVQEVITNMGLIANYFEKTMASI